MESRKQGTKRELPKKETNTLEICDSLIQFGQYILSFKPRACTTVSMALITILHTYTPVALLLTYACPYVRMDAYISSVSDVYPTINPDLHVNWQPIGPSSLRWISAKLRPMNHELRKNDSLKNSNSSSFFKKSQWLMQLYMMVGTICC